MRPLGTSPAQQTGIAASGNGRRKTGMDLLQDPALNKGTAFTRDERLRLGILGLLPPHVSPTDEQARRAIANVRSRSADLGRYIELIALLDRNETLFYRLLRDHTEELMPIIYTPTVGSACQAYAHIFRRPRGLFITREERGMIRDVLRNWPRSDVRVIVVTDGERILGLGDLGASGMGIPVGKLSLYTALGGVPPAETLPVTLDVGTNNETLLGDPLYLGTRERRLAGAEYDALVDEFVAAVQEVFPGALIQFEDFANHNAFRLLEKYRDRACVFNDDIQGTAAVTLAGLLSAGKVLGRRLSEETLLFHGAGEAAIGIANLIVAAMEAEGTPKAEAMRRCWFMDSKALVESGRKDLQEHKRPYAHPHAPVRDLKTAVATLKPTTLIGVSAKPGQFTREIVETMSRLNARPIILALSNPTANSECTAEQAYGWSKGEAIFASGSPFAPVTLGRKTFAPGQANNAYIFPGVGMGVVAAGSKRVTDEMFLESARTLAKCATEAGLAKGSLFPPLTDVLEVSARIAAAVAEVAYRSGLAALARPKDLLAHIRATRYEPDYPRLP